MSKPIFCVLLLALGLAAQNPTNPSDPTECSLVGLAMGNNPGCSGIPRSWHWPIDGGSCYRATVLSVLGERELQPAVAPFSYVTGHTDPATGREFAVLNAWNGMVIVDAHDISRLGPTRLRPWHYVRTDPVSSLHRGHASFGEFLYESNLFRPSLRVTQLHVGGTASSPVFTVTNHPDVPLPSGASYRLTVDERRGHLYVPSGQGLHIYDINGPKAAQPQLLAVWRGWLWPNATVPSFDVHIDYDGPTVRAVVSEYLTVGVTHHIILDVTNLPNTGSAVDPWVPPNWVAFPGSVPGGSAVHSSWMPEDASYLYSSVGDTMTVVYDMRNFPFYNANRVLTVNEIPPQVQQAGSNPPVPLHYPEAPMRQMGMLGLGMTGYASAWQEGFRLYDLRPDNPDPNTPLAYVDTNQASSFHPYGAVNWNFIYPGAFAVYRRQDSGVIYVGDVDNGLFLIRLNVGHMHRYGKGTPEVYNGQPRIPRITCEEAPPRAHTGAAPDPQQKVTIRNLVPGRDVMLLVSTDGTNVPTPFPSPTSQCNHYLAGLVAAPIFVTADANGEASVALPPLLPAQFRLFMQAFSFQSQSLVCEAASRPTWFGLAEPR